MERITIEALKSMNACLESREWFAREFPSGTDLRTAWDACPHDEWRVWFAVRAVSPEASQRLAWRFAGQAFRFAARVVPTLATYADNVDGENWRDAYDAANAAAANDAANAAHYAASYAASYAAIAAAAAAYDAANAAHYAASYDADAVANPAARAEQARWCAEELFS